MDCSRWNESWIAMIYDEIEPGAREAALAHLAECSNCTATLATLEAGHRALRDHPPMLPQYAGRTLLIAPRRRTSLAVSVASGWAAAAAIFVLGWVAGAQPWMAVQPVGLQPTSGVPTEASAVEASSFRAEVDALEGRLAQIEARAQSAPAVPETWLTTEQFQGEMDRLARRFDRARQRDMDYVMTALAESQLTTTSWFSQTQGAIEYLALRQDPRLSER